MLSEDKYNKYNQPCKIHCTFGFNCYKCGYNLIKQSQKGYITFNGSDTYLQIYRESENE